MSNMLEPRIQQHFFDSADLQYQSAEALARPVADAAQSIVTALTSGARVLVWGAGAAGHLAQMLAGALSGRFERARPGLAAWALGGDAAALWGAVGDGAAVDWPARQAATLGQPGDVLVLMDAGADLAAARAAVEAAHGKDMAVIALTGPAGASLRDLLAETDVLVSVPHERTARVLEILLLVSHSLCDAVDVQLLGEQEPA